MKKSELRALIREEIMEAFVGKNMDAYMDAISKAQKRVNNWTLKLNKANTPAQIKAAKEGRNKAMEALKRIKQRDY